MQLSQEQTGVITHRPLHGPGSKPETLHPIRYTGPAILWRDKKMSFLVIYVSNSESTSTSFSSQRDFIFVETFQGQRIQFKTLPRKRKKKNSHYTILATSNSAPIAAIGNFLVSLTQSRVQVKHVMPTALTAWSHFHSTPDGCCVAGAAWHLLLGTQSPCLQR